MDITLKPDTEKLVREKVERGEFQTASELVEEAIHYLLDSEQAEAELEALVREGVKSGPATEITEEDFENIRRHVHTKYDRTGR